MSETTTNTTPANQWNEGDSATFLDLGEIFVPKRAEQTETLLQLIPARTDEAFTIVELAAGGGILAQAILERFPACHYIALDGSATMREQMAQKLTAYKHRLTILPFLLERQEWRSALPSPLRCVVSSLCVHHLDDEEKRVLFSDMVARLEPGSALLLADIIKPATPQIATLFAQQYDEIVHAQSLAIRGDLSGYEQYQQLEWNYFAYDYNDPTSYDKPSLLSDQLRWLHEVGFEHADCFWLQAGHAVYGGYR
ncbi:MAG: class I SAM-dependent methyltransferase [Ktedonobacteraceae bacterium]